MVCIRNKKIDFDGFFHIYFKIAFFIKEINVNNHKLSNLRKLFDEGFSLSALFNGCQGKFNRNTADRLNSAQSDSEQAKTGQVSAFGLRPYTLEEKLQTLKRMIAKGKIALPARVSLAMVKHELKKPENDGLGINEMVSVLKEKKLLQAIKVPAAVFKLKALAPGM